MQLTSSITLIKGAPNSGKTRLLGEILSCAEKRGARTLPGRVGPHDSSMPYSALGRAFAPLFKDISEAKINTMTRGRASEIGVLFPELGFAPLMAGQDLEGLRGRMLWSFLKVLQQLSDANQIVVTMDDLHRADSASLKALAFLAEHMSNLPVKIAASFTPEGLAGNPLLQEIEQSITSNGIACTICVSNESREPDEDEGSDRTDIKQYLPPDESLWTPHLIARAHLKVGDYEEAIGLWNEHGDELPESILNIGLALYWSGNYSEAIATFTRGIKPENDHKTVARISLARAMCLQELGRVTEANQDMDRALEIARWARDDALTARAYRAMNLLRVWTGPASVAERYGELAIDSAKKAKEPALEWSAHWSMAVLAGLTGSGKAVGRHLRACKKLEESLGSPVLPLWTAEVEIEYSTGVGEWDKSIAIGESAIKEARALNQHAILPRLLVWTGFAHLNAGNDKAAKDCFDEAWCLTDNGGGGFHAPLGIHATILAHTGKAAYHLSKREFEEAIQIATRGIALADKMGYTVWVVHRLLPVLGEAHLYLGDSDEEHFKTAQWLSGRMRRDAELLNHKLGMAWADACDALLTMLWDKRPEAAIPLLRKSMLALENIPFKEYADKVRVQLDLAMSYANLGPSRLTEHEREIALLASRGMSNKEIADEMDLSDRTISTHMSRMYKKTGVKSRVELADLLGNLGREITPPPQA